MVTVEREKNTNTLKLNIYGKVKNINMELTVSFLMKKQKSMGIYGYYWLEGVCRYSADFCISGKHRQTFNQPKQG